MQKLVELLIFAIMLLSWCFFMVFSGDYEFISVKHALLNSGVSCHQTKSDERVSSKRFAERQRLRLYSPDMQRERINELFNMRSFSVKNLCMLVCWSVVHVTAGFSCHRRLNYAAFNDCNRTVKSLVTFLSVENFQAIISSKTTNFKAKIFNLVIFFRSSEFSWESSDF